MFYRILRCLAYVMLLSLFVSPFALQAQPIVSLPEPTGGYDVGTAAYDWTDAARDELFTDDPDDKRELLVNLFYPASVEDDAAASPYVDGALRAALSEAFGIPEAMWDGLQTHEYAGAPLASDDAAYPVLIFSPGFGNLTRYYSALLTDLASHGYVIAAISRPYSDPVVVFPGDRVVLENEAGTSLGGATQEEINDRANHIGAVWTADVLFTLDQLELFNESDSVFAGRLDLEHVGVFGHSFGGGAAAAAAYADDRIDAVIDMDGSMYGEVTQEGLRQPFMMMLSQEAYESDVQTPTDQALAQLGMTREQFDQTSDRAAYLRSLESAEAGYLWVLEGSRHNTYTSDFVLFAPFFPDLLTEDMVGTIAADRAIEAINTFAGAFFDQHLKGEESLLLNGETSEYPEVMLEGY
jgi:pimeloyl-ACP methyl ester carboxylesterase